MARLLACVVMLAAWPWVAAAQTFKVLHSFTPGVDGVVPIAALSPDSAGNLIGTTQFGGAYGYGVVYRLSPKGNETVIHSFAGPPLDGGYPQSGVVFSGDAYYGTTVNGGAQSVGAASLGAVYRVDGEGNETVVYSFMGGTDGVFPIASLIHDSAGNLFGTTEGGGAYLQFGTVFKLDPAGNETVLHSFGAGDGAYPLGTLLLDPTGDLFGTALSGGLNDMGVVFKFDSAGNYSIVHNFSSARSDGAFPVPGLVRDKAGNLYGTTRGGGAELYGTVFSIDPAGHGALIYSFSGGADGRDPEGGMIVDDAGNLYGTTFSGGDYGYGTVFKIDSTGNETVLHSFTGGADGANPYAGLVRDGTGNLYGTTGYGGAFGLGVVFEVVP
jgi:uncharacterized repeat protein (TIGR03803 family)